MTKNLYRAHLRWLPAVVCTCLVSTLACLGQAAQSSQSAFFNTEWKLVSLAGSAVPQDGSQPHLKFQKSRTDLDPATAHSSGALLDASDGCNRLTGVFEKDNVSLHITVGAFTALACATPARRDTKGTVAQPELSFSDALRETTRFHIRGANLFLENQNGVALASFSSN